MTKDAEKLLTAAYRAYRKRRKAKSTGEPKYFSSSDTVALLPGVPWDDLRDALAELRDAGYIELYIRGAFDLTPKAVEYGETAASRGFEKLLDLWSKLR